MLLRLVTNYIQSKIKSYDMYGRKISFTYKGEDEYKTLCGGLVSLIVLILLALYTWLLVVIMINREDTQKASYGLVKNLIFDNEVLSLKDTTFSLAFSVKDGGINVMEDETYVTMTIYQHQVILASDGSYEDASTSVNYDTCGQTLFNFDQANDISKVGITQYLCPLNSNFELKGNSYADDFRYFTVNVTKCVNGTDPAVTCKTSEQIDEALRDQRFYIALVNTYFDFDEYDKPIQSFLGNVGNLNQKD